MNKEERKKRDAVLYSTDDFVLKEKKYVVLAESVNSVNAALNLFITIWASLPQDELKYWCPHSDVLVLKEKIARTVTMLENIQSI